MMRPMMLEFPDDPACDMLDRQYMLGDSLLVAPIFRKDGEVQYYLPDGTWTSLLDGGKVEGGHWQTEIDDFMSLPLMVRPGTVLPLGAHDDRPDYDYLDGVELHVYQLADGESETVEIPRHEGQRRRDLHRDDEGWSGAGRNRFYEAVYRGCASVNNNSPLAQDVCVRGLFA